MLELLQAWILCNLEALVSQVVHISYFFWKLPLQNACYIPAVSWGWNDLSSHTAVSICLVSLYVWESENNDNLIFLLNNLNSHALHNSALWPMLARNWEKMGERGTLTPPRQLANWYEVSTQTACEPTDVTDAQIVKNWNARGSTSLSLGLDLTVPLLLRSSIAFQGVLLVIQVSRLVSR